jgi:hypothetical protein
MSGTSTIQQFQRYVWESLPPRREVIGREMVDDVVLVAIQLWPVEYLSQSDTKSQEQAVILAALSADVRRILEAVYGEERFRGYRMLGLTPMAMTVIGVMHGWWHRRKDNRAKMNTWRRRWVVDE